MCTVNVILDVHHNAITQDRTFVPPIVSLVADALLGFTEAAINVIRRMIAPNHQVRYQKIACPVNEREVISCLIEPEE